jgi:REP element-mobilizing transposase RayT
MHDAQLSLFGKTPPAVRLAHGGELRCHKRKLSRPWNSKQPVHVVLRSSAARGPWSLLGPTVREPIRTLALALAQRYGVRLYRYANAGNHLHMLVRAACKMAFQAFLGAFAGMTARLVTGAGKGNPVGKFWDSVAYSRIVSWGREFRSVDAYVQMNRDEALGLKPARARKRAPHPPR